MKLTAAQTAGLVGISVQTLNLWYAWKRTNPDSELVNYLPDFEKIDRSRYWKESDVWKLIKFRQEIPRGCKGILGSITQKYYKKGKKKDE